MPILMFIQENLRSGPLDAFFSGITHLGDAGMVWILLGIGLLCGKKTRPWGWTLLFSLLLAFVTGELILKNIIQRPRPFTQVDIELLLATPTSHSFPSGHSGSSFASATALFLCNKKWGAMALVLAALIAFSRLYLFVHYPTDVLCGILLGVASAFIVHNIMKKKNPIKT